MANPLLDDKSVDFILYELLSAESLAAYSHFSDHGRETFELFLAACRRLAREQLFPAYRPMDEAPPHLEGGRLLAHPVMRELWPQLAELGIMASTHDNAVGGAQLPLTVSLFGSAYLMAANLSAYGYAGLTSGAAHLIESFGSEVLKRDYMARMYAGDWSGTMALTEPQAGSSLADVRTRARPTPDGHFLLDGSKVFISGGDQDFTENIVHLALARIEGAPAGTKGVSLFCVPKLRLENGKLVDNDCTTAGAFHKLGWRGLPSIALNFGERGDCHGFLVGEAGRGLQCMFQMMNEARIGVGLHATATASAAFHASLDYARNRPQGRPLTARDPATPQIPIIEHADVRRMLLRQKSIVEVSLALCGQAARWADDAAHSPVPEAKRRAQLLLDLITPLAKSFPAEMGFESCALGLQVFGGYGYTAEYPAESYLRDQKLNTLHEGTTGIQSLDLLGRKAFAEGGESLRILGEEITAAIESARALGDEPLSPSAVHAPLATLATQLESALQGLVEVTLELAQRGLAGDRAGLVRHSVDYLELFGLTVTCWLWLRMATAAVLGLRARPEQSELYGGKLRCARYWFATELPRAQALGALIRSGEDSFDSLRPEELG